MNENQDLMLLKRLVSKKNLTLKNMNETERWLILSCAALTLQAGMFYSEVEVSLRLKQWLNAEGEMLRIDAIELRRTLIDSALWSRSTNGREYYLATLTNSHLAYEISRSLQRYDYVKLICNWKTENLLQRQERLVKFKPSA